MAGSRWRSHPSTPCSGTEDVGRLHPMTACSRDDVEGLQPFVDLLSISESELATLHPDWTKEEIDDFRKEVESFEEDLEFLREEEQHEDEDGKNL